MRRNLFNVDLFIYAPDEPAGGTPAPAAPAAAAPVTPPSQPVSTPAPATSDASTTSAGQSAGVGTPAPAATPSWLDGFRKEGLNFADEKTAQDALLKSYRDAERVKPLAPMLSQYQQHSKEFNEFLAEKQKKAQEQKAKEDWTSKFYNHPEWDANWVHQVKQDANGNLVPAQGAPADVVLKYQQAQAFRQQQVEQFVTNPFKFIEPGVRHLIQEMAGQQIQQHFGQRQEEQQAQDFVAKNAHWIFDIDSASGRAKTQKVFNPQTGRDDDVQVLSKLGHSFRDNINQAAQEGIPPHLQQQVAFDRTRAAYMQSDDYINFVIAERAKASGTPAPAPQTEREKANAAFVQRANPATPPAPKAASGQSNQAPETVNSGNLAEMILKKFQAAGISGI